MMFVSNAFSFNMVKDNVTEEGFDLLVDKIDAETVKMTITPDVQFSMSAKATEALFEKLTDVKVSRDRQPIQLDFDDSMIVMQYNGPRLPDDCDCLPEGGSVKFMMLTLTRPVWN